MNDLLQQLDALVPLAMAATARPWVNTKEEIHGAHGSYQGRAHRAIVIPMPAEDDGPAVTGADLAFITDTANFLSPENLPKLRAALAACVSPERGAKTLEGHVLVPAEPSFDHLVAMATRYRPDYADLDNRVRENIRLNMQGLYKHATGQGDYTLPAASPVAPAPAAAGPQWVAVADGLPKVEQHWSDSVLALQENGNQVIAHIISSGWFVPCSGHLVPETNKVTHWMPLPATPTTHSPNE